MTELYKIIPSVNYVSFDIFDTVILRGVQNPTDLFLVVEKKYQYTYHHVVNSFANKRINAEKQARDKAWETSQSTEVTLAEIYQSLIENHSISGDVAEQLKQIELKLEEQLCFLNPYMFEVYEHCIKQGKQVIFTSDIYLPESLIATILSAAGFNEYKKLFVSSTIGLTKATGALYQHVIDELQCQPEEILHIGDNYNSDIKMATKKGIHSFYYEKCLDLAKKDTQIYQRLKSALSTIPEIEKSFYFATIINKFYCYRDNKEYADSIDFWYKQGYLFVGILYFSFIQWLIFEVKKQQPEQIYFLARDGFIMQQVYELLRTLYPDIPPSHYIYASRRALNIPAITELNDDDIDFLVSGTSRLTVKAFLQRIDIDAEKYTKECKQVGFESINHVVDTGKDYAQLRDLYHVLKELILHTAHSEKALLETYFKRVGLLDASNIAIVDIGWHGSLQNSIDKLVRSMGVSPIINGYYLGTFPAAEKLVQRGMNISGYLCDRGEPQKYHAIIKQSVEIFEFIHSAPHGSVIKFKQEDNEIKAIFDGDDASEKAQKLQKGALAFITDFLPAWSTTKDAVISKDMAAEPINILLTNPTLEEAVNYGDLEHGEGYGNVYVRRYLAKPEQLIKKLLTPHQIIKDYRFSFWKAGFKKRCWNFWR